MSEPQQIAIDPAEFVRLVRGVSDADLANGLRTNRDLILGEIFKGMAEHARLDRIDGPETVIEWQITELGGDEPARWQLVLAADGCVVERDGARRPAVTLRLAGVPFLRLIADQVSGPQLFMRGKLRISGNLMLAARLPSLFRLPGG